MVVDGVRFVLFWTSIQRKIMTRGLFLNPPTESGSATTIVPLTTIFAIIRAGGDALGPLGLGVLCIRWMVRLGTVFFVLFDVWVSVRCIVCNEKV